MNKKIWLVLILGFGLLLEWGIGFVWSRKNSKVVISQPKDFLYKKYSIISLGSRVYQGSEIIFDEEKYNTDKYVVKTFHYLSDGKKVTGLAHIPDICTNDNKCPVVVQFRGYADIIGYYSGYGTTHSAKLLAENGFISLAPDFLGYAESDSADIDVWVARFETYTTAINLLKSVEGWDMSNGRIGIWGHSNGGQIALTVLEITQGKYPTVLWNPVSIYFPYSVLYYTDDDENPSLRKEVQRLESDYNMQMFSLTSHLDRINGLILLQQGSADQSVPQKWSDSLFNKLKSLNKDIQYVVYAGADHNMTPGWEKVMYDDLEFYKSKL
jgi:dipeptidyl aminopeptidase/acylaminoacyl peptidase